MKRMLLHWACMMITVVGLIGCNPPHIEGPQIVIELARCWQLSSFCGEPTDVDICIDFRKDGKFTIYQRTEELAYTTFTGTYTADEEKSLLSGVYSDGVKWASSYHYTVDKEAETLTLESVERPSEVSIYVPAKVPASATLSSRCASANDVRPL